MNKYFTLTVIYSFAFGCIFGQTTNNKNKDSSEINMRGISEYYIDGFKVYSNLSPKDSVKILHDFVIKLNGKWTSADDKFIWDYKLDKKTFKGNLYNLDVLLAAPFVRLELINGQIKLINSSFIGKTKLDQDTSNIFIYENLLYVNENKYQRLNTK